MRGPAGLNIIPFNPEISSNMDFEFYMKKRSAKILENVLIAVFAGSIPLGVQAIEYNLKNFPLCDHCLITAFDLMDQTDRNNELLRTRQWTAQANERTIKISCCALDVYDSERETGRVFVRLAPLPHARPVQCDDFNVNSHTRKITVLSNGYPFVSREYTGGKLGRIRAFNALQRELRSYRDGRDGRILSNNWGGGYGDSKLDQDYAVREIEAGARIGVDVVQLDDGWQKGRSANSSLIKNRKKEGVWNGYWAFDPNFWDADPVRFSKGLAPLVSAAKTHGMDFGLWYGPDSSNDAANWERDADRILKHFGETGIKYFKIDSMKSFSPLALSRQRAMFDKVLAQSSSNVVFDLDVTAEIRPGYFGLPDIGTLFVENRYAKNCSWWPHQTLRNLWSLSHVIDPVRLRMEFLDPKQHADVYRKRFPESPLRPELWTGDAVFATVMVSSPLAWMEMQGLQPETAKEMSSIIGKWKKERARIHTGVTFPIGEKPDGFAWTGFVTSAADGEGGYALVFRECNKSDKFAMDISPYLKASKLEVLSGNGTAKIDGTTLEVTVPAKLGYVWIKLK
jgi:alpha-galactosidase